MPPSSRPKRRNNYHRNATNSKSNAKAEEMVPLELKHRRKCMFCGHKDIDETLYGPMYKLNDVVVHYFCILLSSLAVQHGADEEGIWGFLLNDIRKELKRGSTITCYYCKQTGATIACCAKQCRKVFHLPCGLKNGSMHQFFQTFKSFCQQHRITQTVDISVLNDKTPTQCAICKEDIMAAPIPDSLWAPCCRRNSWFHRRCVQEMALSAGYFFKCPLCNNVEQFKFRMLTHGIYIPSRDASWETVPDAFAELLDRPSSCTANVCVCPFPEGRDGKEDSGAWNIVLCSTCGSCGVHMLCGSVKCDELWNCESCESILEERSKAKRRKMELDNKELLVAINGIVRPVDSTSEPVNGEPVASTSSGVRNGEPIASSSKMMINGEPKASTSGPMHQQLNVIFTGIPKGFSNGFKNGYKEAFSRGLTNGHVEATSIVLSNEDTETSTRGLSNEDAESSSGSLNKNAEVSSSRLSNKHAEASTSGLSNGHAEAEASTSRLSNNCSDSGLINKQTNVRSSRLKRRRPSNSLLTSTNKQANTSDSESKIDLSKDNLLVTLKSTPSGYNLRRSLRNTVAGEVSEINTNININNVIVDRSPISLVNQQQNSSIQKSTRVIDTITISDSDEDDVQLVQYFNDQSREVHPAFYNIIHNVTPSDTCLWPRIENVHSIKPVLRIIENIDLTMDDD